MPGGQPRDMDCLHRCSGHSPERAQQCMGRPRRDPCPPLWASLCCKRGITPLPSRGHTQKPATGHGHGAKWVQSAFCLWHYFFKKWGTWLIKYFLTCKECRNGKSADPPNTTAEEVGRLSLSTPHPVDRNPKRRRPAKMPCGTATSPPSPPHFQPGTSFKGATSSDSTLCRVLPEHATCQLRCGKPRTQSPLT